MKYILLVSLLLTATLSARALPSQEMTTDDISKIFNESVKVKNKIDFPIFKAFAYNDKKGLHYLVLTESTSDKIKAFQFINNNEDLKLVNTINDYSHWWTKYLYLEDIDKDDEIEPIIVYGEVEQDSAVMLKILTFYKGKKYAIRHEGGILDFERKATVDKAFYTLPMVVQKRVINVIRETIKDGNAIFPSEWEHHMKERKTSFSN